MLVQFLEMEVSCTRETENPIIGVYPVESERGHVSAQSCQLTYGGGRDRNSTYPRAVAWGFLLPIRGGESENF